MTTLSLDDAQGESHAQTQTRQRAPEHSAASTGAQLPGASAPGESSEPYPTADADGAGLVTCAKSAREYAGGGVSPGRFPFPTVDECREGAATVGGWEWDGREGPVPTLEVFPGLVRLTAPDLNRREKTANRQADAPIILSMNEGQEPEDGRKITGWSRRSRARMVATMAELDLAPLLMQQDEPAMVTLTYPGDWEAVAPHGPAVKAHLRAFFKRFERAWGMPWRGVWKLEFQRRGAPHFHLLMVPPSGLASSQRRAEYLEKMAQWKAGLLARKPYWRDQVGDGERFRAWLSLTWADIVAHPDPVERMRHESAGTGVDYSEGQRARDPKRAAVYFGKHGSFAAKDYQHSVPESWLASKQTVGRFWGYRGLKKVHGAATIDFDTMLLLGRTLRRYGTRTRVWNADTGAHEFLPVLRTVYRQRGARSGWTRDGEYVTVPRLRRTTVRATRMTGPMSAGFLLVNDGPGMARTLSRVIETCGASEQAGTRETPAPVGLRGSLRERGLAS